MACGSHVVQASQYFMQVALSIDVKTSQALKVC